jgi:hypothetical protein
VTNTQVYWGSVTEREAQLRKDFAREGVVWICSIEDPMHGLTGGAVCEASFRHAATRLIDRTHRIATAEEIAREEEERRRRSAACAVQSRADRAGGNGLLYIDPKLFALGEA